MTIALARPVLTVPRVVLPALLPSLRPPLGPGADRYATAPRTASRTVPSAVALQRSPARATDADGETTPHLRITRRGRAVLTLLAAVPLSAGAVMLVSAVDTSASIASGSESSLSGTASRGFSSGAATTGPGSDSADAAYVQVASGDSLWSVAETIAPDADPREVIDDLVQTNGLATLDVYPGQQLEIPSRY